MTTSDILDVSKDPSEIVKSFYGQPIGGEWTHSESLKNLDENHVGAVSILSDNKYAIAIDNTIVDNSIDSLNIHSVQLLPNTYDSLINSRFLTPLNNIWLKFGELIGKIDSPIVMGIIYFFVVTPIGLLMKFVQKDLLSLKKKKCSTYWIKTENKNKRMKNQF